MLPRLLTLILLLLVGPASAGNVVLIQVDDVSPEFIHGYDLASESDLYFAQPNIEALAENGVRFGHAYAHARCTASRASIHSGADARWTGYGNNSDADHLPTRGWNLPRTLEANGVATAMIGKWQLANVDPNDATVSTTPQHVNLFGYQNFYGHLANLRSTHSPYDLYTSWPLWIDGTPPSSPHTDWLPEDLTDEAIAMMGALPEPWVIMLMLPSGHDVGNIPPNAKAPGGDNTNCTSGGVGEQAQRMFECQVFAADVEVGRIAAAADLADTTIILHADNGSTTWHQLDPAPSVGGKGSPYAHGTLVPLIFRGNQVSATADSVSAVLVTNADLMPTILHLATGTDPDFDDAFSLLPQLVDHSATGQRSIAITEQFSNALGPEVNGNRVHVSARTQNYDYQRVFPESGGITERFFDFNEGIYYEGGDWIGFEGGMSSQQAAWLAEARSALDDWQGQVTSWTNCNGEPFDNGAKSCWGATHSRWETSPWINVQHCDSLDIVNQSNFDGGGESSTASYFVDVCPAGVDPESLSPLERHYACQSIEGSDDPIAPEEMVSAAGSGGQLRVQAAGNGNNLSEGRIELRCYGSKVPALGSSGAGLLAVLLGTAAASFHSGRRFRA